MKATNSIMESMLNALTLVIHNNIRIFVVHLICFRLIMIFHVKIKVTLSNKMSVAQIALVSWPKKLN